MYSSVEYLQSYLIEGEIPLTISFGDMGYQPLGLQHLENSTIPYRENKEILNEWQLESHESTLATCPPLYIHTNKRVFFMVTQYIDHKVFAYLTNIPLVMDVNKKNKCEVEFK